MWSLTRTDRQTDYGNICMKGWSSGKCFMAPMRTLTLSLSPSPALLLEGYKCSGWYAWSSSSPLLHHPVAGEAGSLCWPVVIDRLGAAAVWVASRVQLSWGLTRLLARYWCSTGVHILRARGCDSVMRVLWTTSRGETCRPSYFSHLAVRSFFNYLNIVYKWILSW